MSDDDHSRADVLFHAGRASSYDRDVTSDFEIYDELVLRPYLGALARGVVADAGCGTGEVAMQLAQLGFDVRAVDHSPDMLAMARQKATGAGLGERITFHVAELTALPFGDSTLDGLTCQRVLHHVPELDPVLAEFRRVLKPGAFLYVSDYLWDDPAPIRLLRRLRHLIPSRRGAAHEHSFLEQHEARRTAAEFTDALKRAGFSFRCRFYSHLAARLVPSRRVRIRVIKVLSYPWRHSRGSMIFVFGVKPDANALAGESR